MRAICDRQVATDPTRRHATPAGAARAERHRRATTSGRAASAERAPRLRDREIRCRRRRRETADARACCSRNGMFVRTPRIGNCAQRGRQARDRQVARFGRTRSPWRAADRSGPDTSSPSATPASTRTPGQPGLAVERAGGRPAAGIRARDPRRRRAPRSRGRAARVSSWRHGSGSPDGDEQLRPHEIDAGDELGDRMLDLQPRVHLEKVERRGRLPAGRSTRNSTVPALR